VTDLAATANRFISNSKGQWAELVELGAALRPRQVKPAAKKLAILAGVDKRTVERKLLAIRFGIETGCSTTALVNMGQRAVLGHYVKGKVKARTLPLVTFPHRVTQPVCDDLRALGLRIGRTLSLKTWDEVWEFVLACFSDVSDQELHHLAGNGKQ
jgi:hypothetical protein